MLRPPARRPARRSAALLLAAGLLVPSLAACGSEDGEGGSGSSEGSSSDALESLTVEGEFGEAIEVTFDGEVEVEESTSTVLSEGDGEELAAGDAVLAHIWVGNGTTEEEALSTYDQDQPQVVPAAAEGFVTSISDALEGVTVGSRVAVAATPEEAFGPQGNPQLGIGNADTVVFVVDLVEPVLPGPEGEEVDPEFPVPTLETGEGTDVTGMTFPPAVEAGDDLQVSYLVRGEGPELTATSTVAADYLGQVLGKDEPFDTSYSRGLPTAFSLQGVVEGWTQGLTGVPVGSRVVLRIPPELGYGKAGNAGAGIGGKDTLFFVIDVLGATNTR